MKYPIRATAALMLAAGLALSGCAGGSAAAGGDAVTLNIVGYAVPEAANKAIAAEGCQIPDVVRRLR
jgi:sulfate transport system substrate-binding protein